MTTCRISHHEYMIHIQSILILMFIHPADYIIGIFQRCREFHFRCQTIGEVYHCKFSLCQCHSIELVQFFIAVNPAAAMNIYDYRKFPFQILRSVNIQFVPHRIRSIYQIIITADILRCCQSCISLRVIDLPLSSHCVACL